MQVMVQSSSCQCDKSSIIILDRYVLRNTLHLTATKCSSMVRQVQYLSPCSIGNTSPNIFLFVMQYSKLISATKINSSEAVYQPSELEKIRSIFVFL